MNIQLIKQSTPEINRAFLLVILDQLCPLSFWWGFALYFSTITVLDYISNKLWQRPIFGPFGTWKNFLVGLAALVIFHIVIKILTCVQ